MSEASLPDVRVRKSLIYIVTRWVMVVVYRLVFRRRVRGLENLPRTGGVVIAANHQSFLDIPLVAVATSRHVAFVARDSLARSKALGFVMRSCGAVLIARGKPDRAALREMLAHLELGDCLVIFPEGTRTRDGRVQEFRAGALLAARKAGVPIVPAAIRGTFEAWPREARLPHPAPISVEFAPPVDSARPDALEHLQTTIRGLVGDGRFSTQA